MQVSGGWSLRGFYCSGISMHCCVMVALLRRWPADAADAAEQSDAPLWRRTSELRPAGDDRPTGQSGVTQRRLCHVTSPAPLPGLSRSVAVHPNVPPSHGRQEMACCRHQSSSP